jgi:hypothetical protein
MTNPPRASIWLDIPEDCQMRAEFTGEHDMQFTLSDHYQARQNRRNSLDSVPRRAS